MIYSVLQEKGFIWLSISGDNIEPLMLLEQTQSGKIKRVLDNLLNRPVNIKNINSDIFSFFPKKRSRKFPEITNSAKVPLLKGFDIIELKARGDSKNELPLISRISAQSDFKKYSKIKYVFNEIIHLIIKTQILLEEHIYLTPLAKLTPVIQDKLRNNRYFVVTEVLKTSNFEIESVSEVGLSNKGNVDLVNKLVESKNSIENSSLKDANHKISYKDEIPITFALKALCIQFDAKTNKFFLNQRPIKNVRGKKSDNVQLLLSSKPFISL